MSENAVLTADQSKIVRELQKAVDVVGETSAFAPGALRKSVADVVTKFRELEAAFPEATKEAREYFYAELPDTYEEKEGYGDALFETLLSLHALYDAESFSRVASARDSLANDLYDLCTFSEEYDVERGCWKADLS